jgi:hypothetical protein
MGKVLSQAENRRILTRRSVMPDYIGYVEEPETIFGVVRAVFCAAAISCFLLAAHRISRGLLLTGRVAAFDSLEDAYTPEEREVLIHKIKIESLR